MHHVNKFDELQSVRWVLDRILLSVIWNGLASICFLSSNSVLTPVWFLEKQEKKKKINWTLIHENETIQVFVSSETKEEAQGNLSEFIKGEGTMNFNSLD